MSSYRIALDKICSEFEAWTAATLKGSPAAFHELIVKTSPHEKDLKEASGAHPVELPLFLTAALGGFRAIDAHLRTNSKGATQSVAFRRVDIWGRLKAFEILSTELTEGSFQATISDTEKERIRTALLRELKDISDLMMSELALRGELSRIAIFLEWLTDKASQLSLSTVSAVSHLAAG